MSSLLENLEIVSKDVMTVEHHAFGGDGTIVAQVLVDKDLRIDQKLEKAYMLTNSIHDAWWNNKHVKKLVDGGCRSTSVGDKINVGGCQYLVSPVGFEEVK